MLVMPSDPLLPLFSPGKIIPVHYASQDFFFVFFLFIKSKSQSAFQIQYYRCTFLCHTSYKRKLGKEHIKKHKNLQSAAFHVTLIEPYPEARSELDTLY